MKTKTVRCELSEQQSAYLNLIAAELRASPGEILLAEAFAGIESAAEECGVAQMLANLRSFVDQRRVPEVDPDDINDRTGGGRETVAVPHGQKGGAA